VHILEKLYLRLKEIEFTVQFHYDKILFIMKL